MLWSVVTVAALGVLLGFTFRVPALLAATVVTVAATGFLLDGPLLSRILVPVLGLHCAYLVGLTLASFWKRIADGGQ